MHQRQEWQQKQQNVKIKFFKTLTISKGSYCLRSDNGVYNTALSSAELRHYGTLMSSEVTHFKLDI
jgi:hypothetical protein